MVNCKVVLPYWGENAERNLTKYLNNIIPTLGLNWDVVDFDETNRKIVLKNTSGLLNYDPHLIIQERFDNNGNPQYIYDFYPCKSYNSSLNNEDQEGMLNKDGNVYVFNLNTNGASLHNKWLGISEIIITNYEINIYGVEYYYKNVPGTSFYYYGFYNNKIYCKFQLFNSMDKQNSGMFIQSQNYSYLYCDNIWYGSDWEGLWNKIFKIDVDKSVGFRHKPSPTGSSMASPYTFFINTQNDSSLPPKWKYIGLTKDIYTIKILDFYSITFAYGSSAYYTGYTLYFNSNNLYNNIGFLTNIKINGQNKFCRILGVSGLVFPDEEVEILRIPEIPDNYILVTDFQDDEETNNGYDYV